MAMMEQTPQQQPADSEFKYGLTPVADLLLQEAMQWTTLESQAMQKGDEAWQAAERRKSQWRSNMCDIHLAGDGSGTQMGSVMGIAEGCFSVVGAPHESVGVDVLDARVTATAQFVGGNMAPTYMLHCGGECGSYPAARPLRRTPESCTSWYHMPQQVRRNPDRVSSVVTLQECLDYTTERMTGLADDTSYGCFPVCCQRCSRVDARASRGPGLAQSPPDTLLLRVQACAQTQAGDEMGPETLEVMGHKYHMRYLCWYSSNHFTAWVCLGGIWWFYDDLHNDGQAQQVVPEFPFKVAESGARGAGPTLLWYVRDDYSTQPFSMSIRMTDCSQRHAMTVLLLGMNSQKSPFKALSSFLRAQVLSFVGVQQAVGPHELHRRERDATARREKALLK